MAAENAGRPPGAFRGRRQRMVVLGDQAGQLIEQTQCHHLTYENVGEEFLFELVALCSDCHERLHQKRRERQEGLRL